MSNRYDIFISYAHLDRDFAWDLYERLNRCRRRRDGQHPQIFLDTDRENGLRPSMSWRQQLADAASTCLRFLAVYSEMYYKSEECGFELGIALNRDPRGQHGIITPVRIDSFGPPAGYELMQSILADGSQRDWFERVCEALNLDAGSDRLALQFIDSLPANIQVNAHLPPFRLHICDESGTVQELSDEVSLRAEHGSLLGDTTRTAEQGVVTFRDISLKDATDENRVIAYGAGFDAVCSEPFRVDASTTEITASTPETERRIKATGQLVFFSDGASLAVIGADKVSTYNVDNLGPVLEEPLPLRGRPRLITRGADVVVVADWQGYAYVLGNDGHCAVWAFRNENRPINVVGDMTVADASVYVGLWSGEVFRLQRNEGPQLLFRHAAGVQAIAVASQDIALVDLDGNLVIYRGNALSQTEKLEHRIYLLKCYTGHLIAVGRNNLYLIPLNGSRMLIEESLVRGIAAVHGESALPVVIDEQGRGVRIDDELGSKGAFHTVAGARPTSADDAGVWCVFENPLGSYTLLKHEASKRQGRIIHSHDGALAVSPAGDTLAVTEPDGIRLIKPSELDSATEH
ncbi:toll/interleukin-1 receptor domain-containing protein [Planctomycetota bacterium]